MSNPAILSLREASFSFNKRPILQNVTLHLYRGDKICLIGRNGSGKSSLLKLLMGQFELDEGSFFLQPGLQCAYLPQQFTAYQHLSVEAFIQEGQALKRFQIAEILDNLQLPAHKQMAELSGGEERRAGIARTLLQEAEIFLLDEPTNHLDIWAIEWLESYIQNSPKAFLVVSHDRTFLKNISQKTWWLEKTHLYPCPKGFAGFEEWQETFLHEQERTLEKIDTRLAQEMHWLHRGVTARRRRNQGRLQRLQDLRKRKLEYTRLHQRKALTLEAEKELAEVRQLMEVSHLSYTTPETGPLFQDFSFRLLKGDRVGIVGPNGCGKSTLVNVLLGHLKPTSGTIRRPKEWTYGFFEQKDSLKDIEQTPWQFLCPHGGDHLTVQGKSRHVVAYLKEFLFTPNQAKVPIRTLSGGERNRLRLAQILAGSYPLLVLDEPTNDLDIETLDFLQDFLMGYPGTLLIVSHDRDFLDNVATSLFIFEKRGVLTEYIGSFSDYLREKQVTRLFADKAQAKKPPEKKEPPTKARQPRLSYHEVRLLEVLPQQIQQWEGEKAALELRLSQAFADENPEAPALSQALQALEQKIQQSEETWMQLMDKKLALEGGTSPI